LPLYQAVIQTSVYAACRDQRFPPVSEEELDDLEIEISVLSPLERISDPSLIKVGKHGLVISKGNKKGLLLPQVPVENNWSRETFLQQACLKAGLPPNTWKSDAEIYVFEAIIFQ
jgi:AmmeMemoRadiSam system protein A